MQAARKDIIQQLQKEVRSLQNMRKGPESGLDTGLRELEKAFADQTFPLGVIHEFISTSRVNAAATCGFMAGLIHVLLQKGTAIWVSACRTVFPPALHVFGIEPERIIFIDADRQRDVLWAIEEALRCSSVAAVVGEMGELSFTESRRLQLAVEQSRVTGFIHRYSPRTANVTACVSRWHISPLASNVGDLPGMGFPRWNVQLQKVRNGRPGTWQIEWTGEEFRNVGRSTIMISDYQQRKTG